MKHVRDLYFHEDTQGYSFEEKSHHPYLGHRKLYIDVAKQIHSSMKLTMAIAITLIGQAVILSGLVLEAKSPISFTLWASYIYIYIYMERERLRLSRSL